MKFTEIRGFLLGIIVTIISFVPLYVVGVDRITELIRDRFIDAALLLLFSLALLTLMYLLKGYVSRKILGISEDSIERVTELALDATFAISRGESELAEPAIRRLIHGLASYASWAFFFKWFFTIVIGALVGVVSIAGTVLLVEQNKIIESQTKILEFEQISKRLALADELAKALTPIRDWKYREIWGLVGDTYQYDVKLPKATWFRRNDSQIENVANEALNSESVRLALLSLLRHPNQGVKISALESLIKSGYRDFGGKNISIKNVGTNRLRLSGVKNLHLSIYGSTISLEINNSYISLYINESNVGILSEMTESFVDNWMIKKSYVNVYAQNFLLKDEKFSISDSRLIFGDFKMNGIGTSQKNALYVLENNSVPSPANIFVGYEKSPSTSCADFPEINSDIFISECALRKIKPNNAIQSSDESADD